MNDKQMAMKLELLCKGVRISDKLKLKFPGYKYKRASLSEGICFDISQDGNDKFISINLAVHEKFVVNSPFYYDESAHVILKNNKFYAHAKHISPPDWYLMKLPDGTLFNEIFQLHYSSILATSLTNFCEYRQLGKGCKFCALGYNVKQPAVKSLKKIIEVLASLVKNGYDFSEININSGAMVDDVEGFQLYLNAIRNIRDISSLPIYAQMCPPKNLSDIDKLSEAGATSISFNIEVFDKDLRINTMPIKGKVPVSHYIETMSYAVDTFGKGQVSSWIIAGLEPVESTIGAIHLLADLGVIPFVTVFRPLMGSEFEYSPPPDPETIAPVFRTLLTVLKKSNLDPAKSHCGCVKCNCCSALSEV